MDAQIIQRLGALKPIIEAILEEKQKIENGIEGASKTWAPNLQIMAYIRDLSPENLALVRLHTINITGMWPLEDFARGNLTHRSQAEMENLAHIHKYRELTAGIPEKYHYREPVPDPIMHNIGVDVDGKLIPRDSLAYQVTLSNLYNLGVFQALKEKQSPVRLLEIGAGYGALANQMGRLLENEDTYFIVDLPETLYWSASYLNANNPQTPVYLYDPRSYDPKDLPEIASQHRFVLLPYWRLWDLSTISPLDLIINMISFHEMTRDQVDEYCAFAEQNLNGFLYSDNQSVYTRNDELGQSIEEILGDKFTLFPQADFYTANGLEWNIRRIHLATHPFKPDHSFVQKQVHGYSYTTDGTTLTRVDDIFRKIKLS